MTQHLDLPLDAPPLHLTDTTWQPVMLGVNQEMTPARNRGPFEPHRLPWVPWGEDNLYPERFLGYLETDTEYERVMRTQARLIAGDDLYYSGPDARRAERALKLLGSRDLVERLSWDSAVFNGCAVEVAPSPHPEAQGLFSHIRPLRFHRLRSAVVDTETGQTPGWFHAPEWSLVTARGKLSNRVRGERLRAYYQPRFLWNWDQVQAGPGRQHLPEAAEFENQQEPRYILLRKLYSPHGDYYPTPEGESAREDFELSRLILVFQKKALENGLASTMLAIIPFHSTGDAEQDRKQQERHIRYINEQLTGAWNAGKVMVQFVHPKMLEQGSVPEFKPLERDTSDQKYIETNRLVHQRKLTALGVIAPELFGVYTNSGFSNEADKLRTSYDLQWRMIQPKQRLVERTLNAVFEAMGLDAELNVLTNRLLENGQSETADSTGQSAG